MRTNDVHGAHVEFFRGLENPIGVKLSKDVASSETNLNNLVQMIKLLNPNNEEGKLVLITRFGARYVESTLPKVLKAVLEQGNFVLSFVNFNVYIGLKVLWVVDGVHGNTQKVGDFKTRKLEDVREVDIIKLII